jgi:hypothetical protein
LVAEWVGALHGGVVALRGAVKRGLGFVLKKLFKSERSRVLW